MTHGVHAQQWHSRLSYIKHPSHCCAAQSYSWLQPSRASTQLPASVQRAMTAKAPATSADGENVRRFVNQASFRVSPGSSDGQQQADSTAGTPAQQQQGRRLAQVMPKRT